MFIHRRTLLKSLSMGAVAPFLAPLVSRVEAETAGRKPMRFVFFLEGNGLPPQHIQPVGIERLEMKNPKGGATGKCNGAESLVDLRLSAPGHSLPEPLTPLVRHAKRVTILQGLSGRVCGGGHSNGFGTLGAYSASAGPKDITIDAALSRANPAIFQHVALGILNDPAPSNPSLFYCCSASGPNQKVPHYQDPMLAYNMLFGKILGGETKAKIGTQTMLLDFMADDIKRLERQLPYEEAQKVQRYAEAFSSISRRQARLGEIDPKKIPAKRDEVYGAMVETKRLEAHFELAATALITGLTNVVTLCSGATSYPTWKGLGINVDNHTIGHNQVEGAMAMAIKIRQFNMELLAKLVDQLQAIPEGTGSMMDNTLIVYLSDSAENHHSVCMEWPMVLLGNLGGRLKTGDRFLNFSQYGAQGHATVAQLYTTFLQAAGVSVDHFGTKDRELEGVLEQKGPINEVLA